MPICRRCGEKLSFKDRYCIVCGLHRRGGKGRIFIKEDYKISVNNNLNIKEVDILERIKNHKIWNYYDYNDLTKEKLNSEKKRIRSRINEIERKIVRTRGLGLPDYLSYEANNLEEQLITIYSYLVLKNREAMRDKISKYYDLEILTQEKIDTELKLQKQKLEILQNTLIYLEENDHRNPDIMEFYIDRDKIRDQLEILQDYSELKNVEKSLQNINDLKLRRIYGRLPDWRIEQIKKCR